MPSEQLQDLEAFFVAYPAAGGKEAKVGGRFDKCEAEKDIEKAASL